MARITSMGDTVDSTLEITIEFSEEEAEQIFSNAIKDFILEEKSPEVLAKLVMTNAQQQMEQEYEEEQYTPKPRRRRRKPKGNR
jgi:hypothetical protein